MDSRFHLFPEKPRWLSFVLNYILQVNIFLFLCFHSGSPWVPAHLHLYEQIPSLCISTENALGTEAEAQCTTRSGLKTHSRVSFCTGGRNEHQVNWKVVGRVFGPSPAHRGPSRVSCWHPSPPAGTRILRNKQWDAVNPTPFQITPSTPLPCVFHEAGKRIFINRPWPSAAAMKF